MLAEMLRRHRKECSTAAARTGRGPVRNADKVFRVSSSLLRWLKLDAQWAGIGLTDARGRSTTVHGIRAGFNTTLRRNSTDPSLRMRLMRHKTADLGFGTYDKVEIDELRGELERLPVASTLRLAAGAETVQITSDRYSRGRLGPKRAVPGRMEPLVPTSSNRRMSRKLGHPGRSWPEVTAWGRSPKRFEIVGPAGLEPATRRHEQPALTIELRAQRPTRYTMRYRFAECQLSTTQRSLSNFASCRWTSALPFVRTCAARSRRGRERCATIRGDTIFGIDAKVEDILVQHCQEWGAQAALHPGRGGARARRNPVWAAGPRRSAIPAARRSDRRHARGLMFDKRSAWCLMGAAPERGKDTKLQDVEVAVMTELPTTRQSTSDVLWAIAGKGVKAERHDLGTGAPRPLALVPSQATTLRHGFATVQQLLPRRQGTDLASRRSNLPARTWGVERRQSRGLRGSVHLFRWATCRSDARARSFCARCAAFGAQEARREVLAGLSAHDLVTWLIAKEAGCVICDPFGKPLDAPLDTTTNISFAAYANQKLADVLIPIVREEVQKHLG